MKIFYFSGTGNSLSLAREIAAGLGQNEAELVPMTHVLADPEIAKGTESIGFVFPVYMAGPPLIVKSLVNILDPDSCGRKYIFAAVTSGGGTLGTLGIVDRYLKRRGLRGLDAGWSVTMPGNYTPLYGAWSEKKQFKAFAALKEKVSNEIVPAVASRNYKGFPRGFWPVSLFTSYVFYPLCSPHIPRMGKKFFVTDKCNGCRLCERVCPVANITMGTDARPVWGPKCQQCMACMQWCPTGAVELGRKTAGRIRYRHPLVTADDIGAQRAR